MSKDDDEYVSIDIADVEPLRMLLDIDEERLAFLYDVLNDWRNNKDTDSPLSYVLMAKPGKITSKTGDASTDRVGFDISVEMLFAIFSFILGIPEEAWTTEQIIELKVILLHILCRHALPSEFVAISSARAQMTEEGRSLLDEILEQKKFAQGTTTLQ